MPFEWITLPSELDPDVVAGASGLRRLYKGIGLIRCDE